MKINSKIRAVLLVSIMVSSFLLIVGPLSAAERTNEMILEAASSLEHGRANDLRGDYQEAIREYDNFLKIFPKNADAYFRRGNAYHNLGDLDRAMQDYSKAIELNPKQIDAYNGRGVIYDELGDLRRAIQNYDKAINLRPNLPRDSYRSQSNDFSEKPISHRPNGATTYNNRGVAYVKLGDMDKGLKDLETAIVLDNDFAEAYYNLGTVHLKLGNFSQAIKCLDKTIELNRDCPRAHYNRGVVYGKLGNKSKEIADYEKAAELDSRAADVSQATKPYYRKPSNSKAASDGVSKSNRGGTTVRVTNVLQ